MGEGTRGERIEILDGFRALAIALVVAFHYSTRWAPPHHSSSLYPYGDSLAGFPFFQYGYLGVELFFIISGFVISLTLFRSADWIDFAWKRFSRLFPAMLLCAVLTFVVLAILSTPPFTTEWRDFLPSLTFTDPGLWEKASGVDFGVIDGVYWSLQVEVKFYFWACLVFFAVGRRQGFLLRFFLLVNAVLALEVLGRAFGLESFLSAVDVAFFPDYLPWFAAGVGFYGLFRSRGDWLGLVMVLESLLVVLGEEAARGDLRWIGWALAVAFFYGLFAVFLLRPGWLAPFGARPVVLVGAASYSLYLLHQAIGVSLIMLVGRTFGGVDGRVLVVAAPIVAVLITLVSVLIYRYWEVPSKRWLLDVRRRRAARADIKPLPLQAPAAVVSETPSGSGTGGRGSASS